MLRKAVSFLILFPLLIVPLFCSCVQKVEAASIVKDDCCDGDSHSAKHDESKSGHAHSCDCGHAQNAVFENLTTSQIHFSSPYNFFSGVVSINPVSITLLKGSIHLAYLGPPGIASEIPLYILQRSFRI